MTFKVLFEIRFLVLLVPLLVACFSPKVEANEYPVATNSSSLVDKRLVYIVSDIRIPFWKIMVKGSQEKASSLGYKLDVFSANNDTKHELEYVVQAIRENVSGIIISPTTSSACVTILKLAKQAGIPVVISDIGTDGGDYVSYISSDNQQGAYDLGTVLTKNMSQLSWDKGTVGIVAIPQKRANGQARTTGFIRAMNEASIKISGMAQQVNFSYRETYDFTADLIEDDRDLRAIWLQGSDQYQAALDAINDAGKQNDILLISFDAEPVFLDLIPKGILTGAAMQQPYLMGQKAVYVMDKHLSGDKVCNPPNK